MPRPDQPMPESFPPLAGAHDSEYTAYSISGSVQSPNQQRNLVFEISSPRLRYGETFGLMIETNLAQYS